MKWRRPARPRLVTRRAPRIDWRSWRQELQIMAFAIIASAVLGAALALSQQLLGAPQ